MMVSVRSAPLLVILLDARVLVVNVQRTENAVSAGYAVRRGKWASNSSHRASDWLFLRRRHHALGDHPGAIARRRALADPAIEDQLHLVGSVAMPSAAGFLRATIPAKTASPDVRRSKTDQDGAAADMHYLKNGCAVALRQLRDRITVQRSGLCPEPTDQCSAA